MHNTIIMPFQKTDAYTVAKELAVAVQRAKIRDAELRDQATRAAKSAFLQVAEGLPNDSVPMRKKYFVCARNSACEVAAALDLAVALEAIDPDLGVEIIKLSARLRAILVGLLR
jgi:four helix bundle protein